MFGTKMLSSFDIVRGCKPAIFGYLLSKLCTELLAAHREQVFHRAIGSLESSNVPNNLKHNEFAWHKAYVREVQEDMFPLLQKLRL